jgi:LPXTG-site transpeptidase (sortase) family protein
MRSINRRRALTEPDKKLIMIKNLRIALFVLSGAFLIAAGAIFVIQWQEGEEAGRSARILLDNCGIKPYADVASPAPSGPEPAPSEVASPVPSDLQGYDVIARLDIAKLDLSLPVLSETTDNALKISACRYHGTVPGAEGNLVITGHDYRNGAIFGQLNKMDEGDDVLLTGKDGKTYAYTVYAVDHIKPDEAGSLYDTEYGSELSLLTCENSGNGRLLVRCRLAD